LPRIAEARGVPISGGFSGIYSLKPDEKYPALFARFIAGVENNHVVMCHPGGTDDAVLKLTRAREYAFLAGDEFPALLAQHDLRVGRLAP
jgi:hypothetical protein